MSDEKLRRPVCMSFKKGQCNFGNDCFFRHESDVIPAIKQKATKFSCPRFFTEKILRKKDIKVDSSSSYRAKDGGVKDGKPSKDGSISTNPNVTRQKIGVSSNPHTKISDEDIERIQREREEYERFMFARFDQQFSPSKNASPETTPRATTSKTTPRVNEPEDIAQDDSTVQQESQQDADGSCEPVSKPSYRQNTSYRSQNTGAGQKSQKVIGVREYAAKPMTQFERDFQKREKQKRQRIRENTQAKSPKAGKKINFEVGEDPGSAEPPKIDVTVLFDDPEDYIFVAEQDAYYQHSTGYYFDQWGNHFQFDALGRRIYWDDDDKPYYIDEDDGYAYYYEEEEGGGEGYVEFHQFQTNAQIHDQRMREWEEYQEKLRQYEEEKALWEAEEERRRKPKFKTKAQIEAEAAEARNKKVEGIAAEREYYKQTAGYANMEQQNQNVGQNQQDTARSRKSRMQQQEQERREQEEEMQRQEGQRRAEYERREEEEERAREINAKSKGKGKGSAPKRWPGQPKKKPAREYQSHYQQQQGYNQGYYDRQGYNQQQQGYNQHQQQQQGYTQQQGYGQHNQEQYQSKTSPSTQAQAGSSGGSKEEDEQIKINESIQMLMGEVQKLRQGTASERKKAYRKWCLEWHPDKHKDDTKFIATCVFQFLQEIKAGFL